MKDTDTIYSNIPLPDKKTSAKTMRWKKFVNMKVGDCVFLETRQDASLLTSYLKTRGIPTTMRKVDDQFGVWRVEDE